MEPSPYFCQRLVVSSTRKSCQENSSAMYCTPGESGKRLGRRHWRIRTDGRIWNPLQKRLHAKEVLMFVSGKKFIFSIAGGTVKLSGGDQDLRTSSLIRDLAQTEEKNKVIFKENQADFLRSPLQDSSLYDGEVRNDFWSHFTQFYLPSSRGTQSQTVRVERSIISYSTEIHRRDEDYKHDPGCHAVKKYRRLL